MAIEIKHPFVSVKGDGGDATLVRPSNWNAAHSTSMATGNLLGRTTIGAGEFEEIPLSAFMAALLNVADVDELLDALGIGAFRTGDVKWSYDTSADVGWIVVNHATTFTIGNAASGATIASADTQALWLLLYANVTNTYAPVSGGRTGVALTDYNANKTLTVYLAGRSPIGAGTGASGITSRDVGATGGAETHTLITAELAVHSHTNSLTDPTHTHIITNGRAVAGDSNNNGGGGGSFSAMSSSGISANASLTGISITNANAGSGSAHNNLHPYAALYAHVKL